MKNTAKVVVLSLSIVAVLGLGAGVTFAGYTAQANVADTSGVILNVKMQRYIFLNVSAWKENDPDYYIYLFTNKTGQNDYTDPAAKQWYKATHYAGDIYWFYVPTKYDNCIFVRAKNGCPLGDIQHWTKNANAIWTQTADIALGSGNSASNYFEVELKDEAPPTGSSSLTIAEVSALAG